MLSEEAYKLFSITVFHCITSPRPLPLVPSVTSVLVIINTISVGPIVGTQCSEITPQQGAHGFSEAGTSKWTHTTSGSLRSPSVNDEER